MVNYAFERRKLTLVSNWNIIYRQRGSSSWKHIHLQVKPNEYEFFMDAMKIWKMSVSKLIEYYVLHYLYEVVDKVLEKEKTDDYLYNN